MYLFCSLGMVRCLRIQRLPAASPRSWGTLCGAGGGQGQRGGLEVLLCGVRPLRIQRFSCLGHHPPWVRAGADPEPTDRSCAGRVLDGLGCSITSPVWDCCAGGFAVRSAVRQRRILHPTLRAEGFVSSVAGIRPSLFASTLGADFFPHNENSKLPYKRSCSEVNLGRAHLLSPMCVEMRNLAPRIIISHGNH